MRLLAKDPAERPESATDVLSALDAIDLASGVEQPAASVDEAHALDSLAGGVFVGRQKEMGDLKAALEDALSGRGRLIMLVGEPGIGKSRTAQELCTYAGLRGAQVLWGRSYEEQGVPPYWPWVQAIRSYVRERDPEQLRSDMGAGAADIAEVVSDVRDHLPGLPPAPQLEPEQARFRLFDSITAFFKTASQRQPLVLVLDDLNWADQPSLMLLQFVARELGGARLLIIGTYRDMELSRQHPLAEALGELTRERLFQRVLLRGLTQEDVGRFIEMTSGNNPPLGLVEAVHSQTEGNPLFVTEVVRLLVQEGELNTDRETDSWTIRIPEGVREVIGRRLNRLSQRCNEALTVASVIGREFTMSQLRPLVEEVTEDRLFEILEEALASRVIEELPQAVGRYQFTHALIQETLSGELSTTRKVRLHARIAEAFEELYGGDAEAHAAELTNHFSEAQTVLGTDRLVRYSLMAGERALVSHAYEEALSFFERGLVAIAAPLDGTAPARDADEASLLFGFGRAAAVTSERSSLQDVAEIIGRAFEYYEKMGDSLLAVAVAEYTLPNTTIGRSVVSQYLPRALKLAAPQSLSAGRLLSIYGAEIGRLDNDYQGAMDVFAQALAIAENEHDSALELNTLLASANVDFFHVRTQQAVKKAEQAIRLASQIGDRQAAWGAHRDAARCLIMTGDSNGALQHASICLELSEKQRAHYRLAQALEMNAQIQRLRGDWQATRDFVERGLTVAPQDIDLRRNRMFLEYESGDFVSGDVNMQWTIERLTSASTRHGAGTATPALIIACVARITGILNHSDTSISAAQELVTSDYANPLFVTSARATLGIWSLLHNDPTASAEQYNALVQVKGSLIPFFFSGDRLLGLLSHTMRNLDQSASHFQDALAFCRKAGYRPELAWTCCDYADMLLERNGEGDRVKATSLLEESLAISSELGMRPLMERVLSRREILGA